MFLAVVSHKSISRKLSQGYRIVYVGNKKSALAQNVELTDDLATTEHYYDNTKYCEISVIPKILECTHIQEIVGLTHYRRTFVRGDKRFLSLLLKITNSHKVTRRFFNRILISDHFMEYSEIRSDEIKSLIDRYDFILPEITVGSISVKRQFIQSHGIKMYEILEEAFKSTYPEALNEFYLFFDQEKIYTFNMLITRRNRLKDYWEWVRPILKHIEINYESQSNYDNRAVGFCAERLLNIYVKMGNYSCISRKVNFIN